MERYIDLQEYETRIKKYVKTKNPEEKELVEWCKDECIRQAYCMSTADVVERSKIKQLIERKYGDLDNVCGCNVNGQWLSIAAIVELIDQAVKE